MFHIPFQQIIRGDENLSLRRMADDVFALRCAAGNGHSL